MSSWLYYLNLRDAFPFHNYRGYLFVLNQTLSNPGTIIMMSVTWIAWWGFEWVVFCLACRYSVVKRADNSEKFLVATERTASIAALLGSDLQTVGTFTGNTQCLKHHVTRCRRDTSCSGNELFNKNNPGWILGKWNSSLYFSFCVPSVDPAPKFKNMSRVVSPSFFLS